MEHRLPQQVQIEVLPLDVQVELLGSREFTQWYPAQVSLKERGVDALEAALQGLRHPNARIRAQCADILDHVGDERCVPALLELARDAVPNVRRRAIHALACQRCKAVPVCVDLTEVLLEFAFHDPDLKVRSEAVFGLAEQPHSQRIITALEGLISALEHASDLSRWERVTLRNARYALRCQRRLRPLTR